MSSSSSAPSSIRKITRSFGGYTFSSDFDSGSLLDIKQTGPDSFDLWVACDNHGTPHERDAYRTWFYFSVLGAKMGHTLTCTIRNLNNKETLFRKGMECVMRSLPSQPQWLTMGSTAYTVLDLPPGSSEKKPTHMELSFQHTFTHVDVNERVEFAYTYPYSYDVLQQNLQELDEKLAGNTEIYYHREMLVPSVTGKRIDLITITSHEGICLSVSTYQTPLICALLITLVT